MKGQQRGPLILREDHCALCRLAPGCVTCLRMADELRDFHFFVTAVEETSQLQSGVIRECGVIGAELIMLRYLFMERAAALARTLLRRGGGFDDVTELFLRWRETLILWCWHLVTLLRSMPTLACWRVGPS